MEWIFLIGIGGIAGIFIYKQTKKSLITGNCSSCKGCSESCKTKIVK